MNTDDVFKNGERFYRDNAVFGFVSAAALFILSGFAWALFVPTFNQLHERVLTIMCAVLSIGIAADGIACVYLAIDSLQRLRTHRRLFSS